MSERVGALRTYKCIGFWVIDVEIGGKALYLRDWKSAVIVLGLVIV
jgi:hypothetical protein